MPFERNQIVEDPKIQEKLDFLVAWLNVNRDKVAPYELWSVGKNMAKIASHGGNSVHCFVAVRDFSNKALGAVTTGQIFKPASWKAPAKHARGDLLTVSTWDKTFTDYGVRYLR